MEDREIRKRAWRVFEAFNREKARVDDPMARFLDECRLIAREVFCGEYHRAGIFMLAVDALRDLGFDMPGADRNAEHRSETIGGAAFNAARDVRDLWKATVDQRSRNPRAFEVVNKADDLMRLVGGNAYWGDLDECAERLHRAVTEWVEGDGKVVTDEIAERLTGAAKVVFGESTPCEEGFRPLVSIGTVAREREVPERVIFSPPATVAFWKDGTKTVAKCSEGDEFSEYVGLLVCIAKRHLRVPRRGTFEDAMARLLRRAERPA